MRISDWSSDVCSSDLLAIDHQRLFQDGADLLARVERAVGVLEDDLHRLAQLAAGFALGLGHGDVVEQQAAGGRRLDQRNEADTEGTRLHSSHYCADRMPPSVGQNKTQHSAKQK